MNTSRFHAGARQFAMTVVVLALVVGALVAPAASFAAIAQRGTPTTSQSTTSGVTVAKPTGVVAGDVMIVNISKHGNTTTSTGSGWTLVRSANMGGLTPRNATVMVRVAGPSEPGSYTFSLGASAPSDNPGAAAAIVAYSGVDNTTPIEATGTLSVGATTASVSAATISSVSSSARVVMFGMASNSWGTGTGPTFNNWSTATSPGALSEIYDYHGSSAQSVGAADATKATAGSTGAGGATVSVSTRATGGLLVALKQGDPVDPVTASVTSPVDGTAYPPATLPTFAGQAADDAAGAGLNADSTTFRLQRASDAWYWNGLSWQEAAFDLTTTHAATTGGTSVQWTRTTGLPDWSLEAAGTYSARATATDKAGHTYTGSVITFDLYFPIDCTVTAAAADKVYDASDTASVEVTSAEFVVGDDVTATYTGAHFDTKNVGVGKPVEVTGIALSGTDAWKYNLLNTTASTAATITAKGLTVTGAVANDKTYDATNTATVNFAAATLVGAEAGDDVALDTTSYSATFDNKNVAGGKDVSVVGVALSGADAGNYTVAQPTGLTAAINPLGITGEFTAENKTYDGSTDATVTQRALLGVLGDDDVTLAGGTAAFANAHAGAAKDVFLSGASLSGADSGNYSLDDVATAHATIAKREVTAAANNASKVVGNPDPPLTYVVTSGSLVAGDDFSGAIERVAGETVGTYPIIQGTLALSDDYDLAFVDGMFTIAPATDFFQVWRFRQKNVTGSYLWTADPNEMANVSANLTKWWLYEGVAFNINEANPVNDAPLWRFRNLKSGTYLYTADVNEKTNIQNTLSGTWFLEGYNYSVSVMSDVTTVPVWRFRCLKNATYLWTSDPNEKLTIETTLQDTYRLEGVAYYIGQ